MKIIFSWDKTSCILIHRYQPFGGKCYLHYKNWTQIPNPIAVSCTKARVKERIRYYIGDQIIPKASSFKYLGIIIRSDLNWADHVNQTLLKAWKVLHFVMRILRKGNNTKYLAYTALVGPILEYGAVCWDR